MEQLRTGKLTLVGDQYPSVTVDSCVTPGSRSTSPAKGHVPWDQCGSDPLKDLKTWALAREEEVRRVPAGSHMDVDVFALFVGTRRSRSGGRRRTRDHQHRPQDRRCSSRRPPRVMGTDRRLRDLRVRGLVRRSGRQHGEGSAAAERADHVSPNAEGVRLYGAIQDLKSLQAVPYFVKSGTTTIRRCGTS
jgi:hypothetical protein